MNRVGRLAVAAVLVLAACSSGDGRSGTVSVSYRCNGDRVDTECAVGAEAQFHSTCANTDVKLVETTFLGVRADMVSSGETGSALDDEWVTTDIELRTVANSCP